MNSDEKLSPSNITEIIEKMNENLRGFAIRETEWIIQKNAYESKISELEGEISAHEQINIDLMKRIKMLEYALIQERSGNQNYNPAKEFEVDKKDLMSEEDLLAIKEKASRPSLLAMLNEIGINENFANELFTDLELNKAELERIVKRDIEERTLLVQEKLNVQNERINNNYSTFIEQGQPKNYDYSNTSKRNNDQTPKESNKNSNILSNNMQQVNNSSRKGQMQLNQNNYTELRSHFDVVRKLNYISKSNYLVSISEDCLINIWATNKINFNSNINDLEPSYCFRGHTGPLFALETKDDIIYTAGCEGVVKVWKIPSKVIPIFSDSDILLNCNIALFQKSEEIIWDLKHHPSSNLLLSLASDGCIYFWRTGQAEEYQQSLNEGKMNKWFLNDLQVTNNFSPTVGVFLSDSLFACGLTDGNISFVDVNKVSVVSNTKNTKHLISTSSVTKRPDADLFSRPTSNSNQIDSLCTSWTNSIIYAGFEDGTLKSFDYRTENCYNPIQAHDDAITSINIYNDLYLFTTSHDTKIRLWDVRDMSQPLQETLGSQKKWDEAILDGLFIQDLMCLATAGADSVIRLFKV